MKKFFLSVFTLSALMFTSCSDDDKNSNNDDGGSTATVDPNDFALTITGDVELDNSFTYNLTGPVVVSDGASLTIPEGTVIEATGGTSSYIAVAQGGKIFINGESDNPVIMTSGEAAPGPGDWGGLVVCGKAPTNKGGSGGQTATSEVADLTYGGSAVNDNSGSIRYLRIEYTGAEFSGDKQFNGLSLFGVGNGTTVEYVQSFDGRDDGIEFFGGTVNGKYLVSTGSGDDSIDFADGWAGKGSYWYISGGAKAGIEGSNNGDDGAATPMTTATLENISIVGPGSEGGMYIKEGGGMWSASNIYIEGFEKGIYIKSASDDPEANARVAAGDITFDNIQFESVDQMTDYVGSTDFITEGDTNGAGNGAEWPTWAQGWTRK